MQTIEMKTIEEIRRENLIALRSKFKSLREMAERLRLGEAQISQWINASKNSSSGKPRNVSSESCRAIEELLDLEIGWMDHPWDEDDASLRLVRAKDMHPATKAVLMLMEGLDDHGKMMLYTNAKQMADLIKSASASREAASIPRRQ